MSCVVQIFICFILCDGVTVMIDDNGGYDGDDDDDYRGCAHEVVFGDRGW